MSIVKRLLRPSRPFVAELEVALGLSYVLFVVLALFLEHRLIILARDSAARLGATDRRVATAVGREVVQALDQRRLTVPESGRERSDRLLQLATASGLSSIDLVRPAAPWGRIDSGQASPTEVPDIPFADVGRYGFAYESDERALWWPVRPKVGPELMMRIEFSRPARSSVRSELRLVAIAVPVVLLVIGAFLLLFLLRISRRMAALVEGAVASGQVDPSGGPVDETRLVENALEKTVATLREREGQLRDLLDRERDRASELDTVSSALRRNMPGGLIAVTGDGAIRDINRRARALFGLEKSQVGLDYREALADQPDLSMLVRRALSGQETVVREEIRSDVEAVTRELTVSAVPLTGRDAAFLGVLVFAIDVTDVRELQRRLRAQETMASLGEISAGLAHELRNSVAAALGYGRLAGLDLDGGDEEATRRQLHRINDELKYLSRATEGFLEFTRTGPIEGVKVDVLELAQEVVDDFRTRHPDIEFELDCSPAVGLGEPTRIRQVIANLVGNAVQEVVAAESTARWVGVEVLVENGSVRLVVEDRGRGVPTEIEERMFLPFVSQKEEGTGLGLSLVHRSVVAMGGTVHYERPPGGGSRFVVQLVQA